ncbi:MULTISPECIES: IMS domain-containing protein [Planktothricoides]|uniref:IMS domain-containing protein n=2 Tax=Planktothricoides raciborskii TaxID=132608 RepID=A0AAU8JDX2_9CYAN|nr:MULTISPECIES: IMS domain-containing protein [Planktothricoides]KOR35578.1 hypothetical protein AM228_17415 [Planktothricoides sp. SR001]MBD2545894.1 DUF4101 domain-containing protein [Planktothricoides raciborskii FACHB-1370]MBD2584152.1 DUF4101 domain-containing protein [Planktothricoides raciborskii FACHB-1261]
MLVPLDYYRILGLPIQATAEQLQQAHRDRSRQYPRREYSDIAIDLRKQLIDEAYAILSDPEERQIYDASFLAKTYNEMESGKQLEAKPSINRTQPGSADFDPHTPSIGIEPQQLVGALLILQELGEYELVLKLGLPHLGANNANNISQKPGFYVEAGGATDISHRNPVSKFGDPQLVVPDIVLTLALACLELGREQWQQGQYQKAATSLETGQELLLREELFPSVRGEIQADLYKLRPYRILELLALPESKVKERRHGLELLRDMLEERQGIDGSGDDRSGLNVDDFLRFIQQLRSHLTAGEQQELFEAEARRPSAVATYLAVYALIARGFANRQPALIRRASLMLTHLARRQDVHLEQAVCALLLGQTEQASHALDLTQEHDVLEFIRENSKDSPDLLPGLCLYGERWLQSEVFPYFRDLLQAQVSLKDYFADPNCQAYLESLPESSVDEANQWMVVPPPKSPITVGLPQPAAYREPTLTMPSLSERMAESNATNATSGQSPSNGIIAGSSSQSPRGSVTSGGTTPTTISSPLPSAIRNPSPSKVPVSTPSPSLPADRSSRPISRPLETTGNIRNRVASADTFRSNSVSGETRSEDKSRLPIAARVGTPPYPPQSSGTSPRSAAKSSKKSSEALMIKGLKVERLVLVGAVGLVGIWLFWSLLRAIFFSGPTLKGEQLQIYLSDVNLADKSAVIPIPDPQKSAAPSGNTELNQQQATQVIQQWFALKSQALGPQHQFEQLNTILLDPALSSWRETAQLAKQQNWYWEYQQHQLNVRQIEVNKTDPNQATVEVDVTEVGKLYEGGQFVRDGNEQLRVRYELVRDKNNGQWRLRNWEILQ